MQCSLNLLSQMGLVVFSTPGRGTKQNGVDIAAIGSIDGEEETIYLFSIKSGDLTRSDWNGSTNQALKPSLDEIRHVYIRSKLQEEQQKKPIKICLCFGGVINETVQADVAGYIAINKTGNINYEIWNGDKLSEIISRFFLNETLLPSDIRTNIRKSLALIDNPDSSSRYFICAVELLIKNSSPKKDLTIVRQVSLCLWVLYSWCRDASNVEAAYLSSEASILKLWSIVKKYQSNKKSDRDVRAVFDRILELYLTVNKDLLLDKIAPLAMQHEFVSSRIYPPCKYVINSKLFDIVGRFATYGLWLVWKLRKEYDKGNEDGSITLAKEVSTLQKTLANIINNNHSLGLPFKDENIIDITLVCIFLLADDRYKEFVGKWLYSISDRALYALTNGRYYPRVLSNYYDFLDSSNEDDEYKKHNTHSSVLYPMLAFFAALLKSEDTYKNIQTIKKDHLPHCNFQV